MLSLKIKDKKAYVNLNKAFDEGVTSDLMKVANLDILVATLCLNEILEIDEVQLLLEGKISFIAPMGEVGMWNKENIGYHINNN